MKCVRSVPEFFAEGLSKSMRVSARQHLTANVQVHVAKNIVAVDEGGGAGVSKVKDSS